MYLIDKKLAQTVLNYLGTQPYVQVRNIIKAMENMPDYDEILKTQQAVSEAPMGEKTPTEEEK